MNGDGEVSWFSDMHLEIALRVGMSHSEKFLSISSSSFTRLVNGRSGKKKKRSRAINHKRPTGPVTDSDGG